MNSLQNRSTLLDKQYDTGQFSACIVTNIGKEMIAKSQNGQTLTFTRVALGDGLIDDDDDILSFTKVKNERLSANIAKWVDKQNGQFQIQFRVSNQEVEIGFWQREIGIMAKIDGGEEQLYAYATSGNGADFLYDKTTPIDERIVNIDFVIGNAENVQVIVNGSIIYATIEDLENAIDEHNADENAHDNLIKRLFGSAEATLDSIKLKIKEWAKEVCLPLSGGTMKGNINANGYNITATKFIGNLQGKADSATNADLATKANQDSQGQTINTTYIKSITASNATLTLTKGNGTTSTVTINNVGNSTKATQDSQGQAINTTYIKGVTGSNATLTITKGNGTSSTVTINNVAHSTNSDTATKAIADKNGLQIDTNYLKNTGGSIIGNYYTSDNIVRIKTDGDNTTTGVGIAVGAGSVSIVDYNESAVSKYPLQYFPNNKYVTTITPPTSDNSRCIATTAFVKSLFTASKQQNGWWKEASTGIIWQWGNYANPIQLNNNASIDCSVQFPISFTNCIQVIPILYERTDDNGVVALFYKNKTNSSVDIVLDLYSSNGVVTRTARIGYIAIGY